MSEETRARTAVARLEMLSFGSTRNYNGDGRGNAEGSPDPAGGIKRGDKLTFMDFRARLAGCGNERDFRNLADDAEAELLDQRITSDPPRDSEPWQDKAAKEPGSIRVAAKKWQISPAYMHQLRERAK